MSSRPRGSLFDRVWPGAAVVGGHAPWALHRFPGLVGAALVVLGGVAFASGAMGDHPLFGLRPGLATREAGSALAFVLAGLGLLTLDPRARSPALPRAGALAAAAVSLLALLTLLESASGRSLGLDQARFEDPGDGFFSPGRMASNTAVGFLLLGLGLALARRGRLFLAQLVALGTAGLGAVAVAADLYGAEASFRAASSSTGMALPTALGFLAAGLALLLVRPDEGFVSVITGQNLGGVLARKLLPVAVLGPMLLGWAVHLGHRLGFYAAHLQLPVVVVTTVALLTGLVWMNAGFLSWFDHDREDAVRRLSERAERERRLLAASIMGVAIIDRAGVIIEANEALLEMLGYDPRAILGRSLASLSPAEPGSLARHGLREAQDTGRSAPRERTFLHRDGTRIPVLVGLVLLDPERGEVVAYAADLREQKNAEAKAAKSESRYRHMFEQDLAGALRTTGDGTIIDCNAAFARTFGFAGPEAARGTRAGAFDPEGQQSHDLRARLMAEGVVEGVELELRRVDGRPVNVLANLAAFLDAEGRLAEVDGLLIDVTEQRGIEAQLRQAQRVESVGRLAGGVAHDFNNLLAVVTGYAELLRGRLRSRDPRLRYVGEIRKAADRAAALTRQLLAFSRQQVLRPRVLDLDELLAGMEGMLRRLIGEHIELVVRGTPDLGRVLADPGQVEQVIMNLVLNARDAMPDGGRLVIETSNAVLDEAYVRRRPGARAGNQVMVAVSDTGQGMDAATQSRIFEPFFTTKEVGKGTGLGLATTYGIVKQSGGSIWVRSEPGQGSVFEVYLPRVDPGPAASEGRAAADEDEDGPPPAGRETILVVEDEASLSAMMVEALRSFGYKVRAATDPQEAVRLAGRRRPPIDLLVTDVVMPGMSGRDLAQKVRKARPGLPVLFVSGYTDDTALLQGISRDELCLLQKPFGPRSLARRIRELLDRPQARGGEPDGLKP